jgi:hypothetical protein
MFHRFLFLSIVAMVLLSSWAMQEVSCLLPVLDLYCHDWRNISLITSPKYSKILFRRSAILSWETWNPEEERGTRPRTYGQGTKCQNVGGTRESACRPLAPCKNSAHPSSRNGFWSPSNLEFLFWDNWRKCWHRLGAHCRSFIILVPCWHFVSTCWCPLKHPLAPAT